MVPAICAKVKNAICHKVKRRINRLDFLTYVLLARYTNTGGCLLFSGWDNKPRLARWIMVCFLSLLAFLP